MTIVTVLAVLAGLCPQEESTGREDPPPPPTAPALPPAAGLHGLWEAPAGLALRVRNEETVAPHGMRVAPGAEITLAELTGPGLITHLWMGYDSEDPHAARHLVLRAFWDGEREPSIEVPLGDFFGCGFALARPVPSTPVQASADGRSRHCYWPMPFNRTASIRLRNDSAYVVRSLGYHVDWRALDEPFPDPLRTFHASYRQAQAGPGVEEFVLAEVQGAGHYVGTVLSCAADEAGLAGLGSELFRFEGEEEPRVRGSGLAAYFGGVFELEPGCGPDLGVPLWEGTRAGARWSAYRWHLRDSLPFERSLKLSFELKGRAYRDGRWQQVGDRRDHYSGVAYWYQEEPHQPFPALPLVMDRLPFLEDRIELEGWTSRIRVRGEARDVEILDGGGLAGGGGLRWTPGQVGAALSIPFEVETGQAFDLVLCVVEGEGAGAAELWLDDRPLPVDLDLRGAGRRQRERVLGRFALTEGEHRLELRARRKGESLELDSLVLRW